MTKRKRRMFSYVVEHDYGLSPNPSNGLCTLAFCKYRKPGGRNRNVVELAEVGDWVVGTGGASKRSAGAGKLVYAMRVTEKKTLQQYFADPRFTNRAGNEVSLVASTERFALVSDHYFYFGADGPDLEHDIDRAGRNMRSKFTQDEIADFVSWLEAKYPQSGELGVPCRDLRCEDDEPELIGLGVLVAPRTSESRRWRCTPRHQRIC